MFLKRFGLLCVVLSAAVWLTACGGSSKPSVAVTASPSTVDGGDAVTLTATVTHDKSTSGTADGVTWTVSGGNSSSSDLTNTTTTSATFTAPTATSSAQTITVTATSVADTSVTGTATLTVPAAPTITTTAAQLAGAVGTAYSVTLAGSGGISPYTWTLDSTSSALPCGFTMTAGVISGTPVASCVGTYPMVFDLTDSGTKTALTAQASLSLVIAPAATIVFPTTTTLTAGTYNVAYAGASVAATRGSTGVATTLTYALNGTLPTGLTFNTSTGAITGKPSSASAASVGTFTFTVTASDGIYGDSATSPTYTIVVSYPAMSITTTSLPTGYIGSAYTHTTLAATGGAGVSSNYTWTLVSGPAGLSVSAGGVVSGTPTAAATSLVVSVTDSTSGLSSANTTIPITIDPAVSLTSSATLPTGYGGTAYSTTLTATGGSGTGYTWAATNLPTGFALSAAGVLSATSTVMTNDVAGSPYSFSATVTDSAGNTASPTFSLIIDAGVSVVVPTIPVFYPGASYAATTFTASGGSGTSYTYSWAAASGSVLPSGLSLTAGAITGTPANATTSSVTSNLIVTATDSLGNIGTATFSLTIEASIAVATASPLPTGGVGAAYSQTLTATGGTGTYTWTVPSSTDVTCLATLGLSLNSAGVLSSSGSLTSGNVGTCTNFGVQVSDNATPAHTASKSFTVAVSNFAITTTTLSPAYAYTGTAYSTTLGASGGSGSYTWSVTAGATGTNSLASVGLSLSSGGVLSGTTSSLAAGTATFTVKATDANNASLSANQQYTIVVYTALSLTAPSSTVPGPAIISTTYTGSTIYATGGSGNYSWSFNGSLPPGWSSNNPTGNSLVVSGTAPSTSQIIGFYLTLTDITTGKTYGPITYSIAVNPPGSTVSGQFSLANYCSNGSSNLPVTFTVGLYNSTTLVQSTTTDVNGNYSFTNISNGTYTITPSLAGAATLFYPASYTSLTLDTSSNNNVTGENFNANVGFTVSGTVSYSGAQTGQTYLTVNNNNCGSSTGTSITEATLTSGGAYTIRGVPPGSNTISAWMDPLGQGLTNAIDPTGSTSSPITVDGNVSTGADVTIADPTFTTPSENPTIQSIIPNAQGVLIEFKPSTISPTNSEEDANQYLVQWSTSPTLGSGNGGGQFGTIAGSHTFTASGDKGLWVLTNYLLGAGTFTSGQTYYFQARSVNTLDTTSPHSGWCDYNSSSSTGCSTSTTPVFTGVVIGTPACTATGTETCTAVSSSVTIPAGITINTGAPLYLGLLQMSSAGGDPIGFYFTEIANPVNGVNNFPQPITVPSGSNYVVAGILDQQKTGGFGAGAISNVGDQIPASAYQTITASTTTVPGITLPTTNAAPTVSTQWSSSTCQGCGATTNSYQLNFDVREGNKLPVAVTLLMPSTTTTLGPNLINTNGAVAIDLGNNCNNCGNPQFQYSVALIGETPNVGDAYDFTVTYSDGTQDTGSTVNTAVTGWDGGSTIVGANDAVATASMLPIGVTGPSAGTSTTPTFTWTDSSSSTGSDFNYSFYLSDNSSCSGNCTIWQIPGQNSKSNGFSSSILSITWGIDPTGDTSNVPSPDVPLTTGDVYNWQIQVQDPNGNQAQTNVWYQP